MRTIKFDKTRCGVEVLLRVGSGEEIKYAYTETEAYNTDYFEVLIFRKAKGHVVLNQQKVSLSDNSIVFFLRSRSGNVSWTRATWILLFLSSRKTFSTTFLLIGCSRTGCYTFTSWTTR